jgi:transcriptional regulator with XRE-family HTH domain
MRVDSTAREGPPVTMFSDLLLADRERNGLTVEQMARRLGVSPLAYPQVRGRRAVAGLEDL